MIACLFRLSALCAAMSAQTETGVDHYSFEQVRAQVIRKATAHVEPALVTIETIGGAQPVRDGGPRGPVEESFRLADGPTTGLVISSDGLIITSSFNFARDPAIITVTFADGRRSVAKLLGRDHIRRLALIKVDEENLPEPDWVPSDELQVGQYAMACGRGLGGTQPFVSLGIVSALNRRNGNAVQTDAKVSPINYGGPLVDIEGRVMGILVPMAGSGGALAGARWYDSGIGFAIYKREIDGVFDRLAAGETIEQGKIGVILEPDEESSLIPLLDKLLPPAKGVKIREVLEHSPASRSDLRVGDKILAIDGQPTGDLSELQRRLSDRAAGETIMLTVKRRWRKLDVKIKLVPRSEIGKPPEEDADSNAEESSDEPTTRPVTD
ncbi:MAG: S1C family serine protease [Phycisphaerales bacterium]|nr:S1C family serine protease [Phycisphaerales bacterium]